MAQFTGKVIKVLDVQSGENDRGMWYRGGIVVAATEDSTHVAAFTIMGEDKLKQFASIQVNDMVVVTYRPKSREFNDRWFTDLMVSSISRVERV